MTRKVEELENIVDSDHEMILLLKKELGEVHNQLEATKADHHDTIEQLSLHEKISAQQTLLKHIFYGVVSLIICMWSLVFVGWFTQQESIEREMAFFERIILVLIGIVGGAISSFFDVRNFTLNSINGGNGNGNGGDSKKPDDTG